MNQDNIFPENTESFHEIINDHDDAQSLSSSSSDDESNLSCRTANSDSKSTGIVSEHYDNFAITVQPMSVSKDIGKTSDAAVPQVNELAKYTKRGTIAKIMHGWGRRQSTVQTREHYRRGTVVLKQMEKKVKSNPSNVHDKKLYDTLKTAYDSKTISATTVIGISLFSSGTKAHDPFAVNNLPLEIQIGFRQKLYGMFCLQLIITIALLALFEIESIKTSFKDTFTTYTSLALISLGTIGMLAGLYWQKTSYPTNYVILLVFTGMESITMAAYGAFFDSYIVFYGLTYTTSIIFILYFASVYKVQAWEGGLELISHWTPAIMSYFFLLIPAIVVQVTTDIMPDVEFALATTAVFVVMLWFAYDASCQCTKMAPDEYMQGVIFFYTDLIIFLIFLLIVVVAVMSCEGGGDVGCCSGAEVGMVGNGGTTGMGVGVLGVDGEGGGVAVDPDVEA